MEDQTEFREPARAEFKDAESRFGFGKIWKSCPHGSPPELLCAVIRFGFFVFPARRFQVHNDTFQSIFLLKFVRASAEAILGTQR